MSRHLRAPIGSALAFVLFASASAAQTIIYVHPGAAGTGNGQCATPFGTVADALARAKTIVGPTELRLEQGTYAEHDLVIDFSDVTIKGGYPTGFSGCANDAAVEAGRNAVQVVSTIDAAELGRHFQILPNIDDNGTPADPTDDVFLSMNTGIVLGDAAGADLTFDRLALVNGKPQPEGAGGSILQLNTQVAITNTTFRNNTSANHFFGGGAIYLLGYATAVGQFNAASLDLTNDLFDANQTGRGAPASPPTGSGFGGAIFAADLNADTVTVNRQTRLNVTDTVFRANISNGSASLTPVATFCPDTDGDTVPEPNLDCDTTAGAETCASRTVGGAVFLNNVGGNWTGNTFQQNTSLARQTGYVDASGQGGAMAVFSSTGGRGASPNITNNTFTSNVADAGRGSAAPSTNPICGYFSAWGGALYLAYFAGDLRDNTFNGNRADATGNAAPQGAWGGGVFLIPQTATDNHPLVDGNTFNDNRAIGGGGRVAGWGGGMMSNEFGEVASPVITNNVFTANAVSGSTGGSAYGGGLFATSQGLYTLIAGNRMENNTATGAAGRFAGIGAGLRTQMNNRGQLIADNQILGNTATEIDPTNFPFAFSGAALLASVLSDTTAQPILQNNLFAENVGIGLTLIGFPDYDAAGNPTGEFAFATPGFVNNTLAANEQAGLAMNVADDLVIENSIIFGNDTTGSGTGDIFDEFLADSRPSANITVTHSLLGTLPATEPASLISSANDPANFNLVGDDPLFVTGPGGGYYLKQPPDQAGAPSPAVDAGDRPAGAVAFGTGLVAPHLYAGQNMAQRTTRSVSRTADLCFVDLGFHYPLGAPAVDTDGDTIPDADEGVFGTNPLDADSDDDGLQDGIDCGGDVDGDGTIAALDCDADGDGLTDGLESGVTMPVVGAGATAGTNTTATCNTSNAPLGCHDSATTPTFTADTDPVTRTDYLNADTDGGGELDGCEDVDGDGRYDVGPERNPDDAADDDADHDGINAAFEVFYNTDPLDADTDDDGIGDNVEADFVNFEFNADPIYCDTDEDGILDGVERTLGPVPDPDGPNYPGRGTDCPRRTLPQVVCSIAACFAPDADPTTRTHTYCDSRDPDPTVVGECEGYDTDADGCSDGAEDANHNGAVDTGETDPLLPGDCGVAGANLWVEDRAITALVGGTGEACGPETNATEDSIFGTSCAIPVYTCDATRALSAPPASTVYGPNPQAVSGTITFAGAAAASFETAVLTIFEIENCANIRVRKVGADIVVDVP